jgi:hypothetical protein
MTMDHSKDSKPLTLSDADISSQPTSQPAMTRRSLLGAIGIGAGLAAAVVITGSLGTTRAAAADPQGQGRACRYRDNDWSVRPQDNVRVRCGISDNDTADRVNHGRRCSYRDSDRGAGRYKDTIRVHCGRSDNDR